MNCPVCKTTSLVMTERQSIEIDYCPDCRGVWLDRGELDKIIERSVEGAAPSSPRGTSRPDSDAPREYRGDHKYGHDKKKPYYKKKSLLGELFDF